MGLQGDRLRKSREAVGISQRELSRQVGLGENAVYKMEKNIDDPGVSNVAKIAEQLDVSLDYLTGRTADPKSHKGIKGLSAEDQEFLAALHRRDIRTIFNMIGVKIDEYLDQKAGISSTSPGTDE
jgi:transcriptional regulator with XRE-family HTH domain